MILLGDEALRPRTLEDVGRGQGQQVNAAAGRGQVHVGGGEEGRNGTEHSTLSLSASDEENVHTAQNRKVD